MHKFSATFELVPRRNYGPVAMSINYPDLSLDVGEPAPIPLAPPPEEAGPAYHECGICQDQVHPQLAHTVLECRHLVHLLCTRGLLSRVRDIPSSIGGTSWCSVCRKLASASGGWDASRDASLGDERIIDTLNAMHVKRFRRDVQFEMQNGGPSRALEKKLLGSAGFGKRMASAVGSLAESMKLSSSSFTAWSDAAKEEANRDDDSSDEHCDPSTIADRMVRAGRTLDRVFETTDADIADLYNAGLHDLASLRKLGFSVGLHLTEPYRRRLPVFALASHFGLSWDDIKTLSPRTVCSFKLTAAEFRLLRCEMKDLVKAQWKAKDVLHMGIAPSKLVKYLGMEVAHMNALGLSLSGFTKNERWRRDFEDKSSEFHALVSNA